MSNGVPILETPRLRLRPYRAEDVEAMFALYSDPRVMRYWSFPPWTEVAQARTYLDRALAGMDSGEIFPWAIAERDSDVLIGALTLFSLHVEQLRAEVGYSLSPDYQGRGLAAEALRCGLACAIDTLGLVRIEADIDPRNEPSAGCWKASASSARACCASAGGSTAKSATPRFTDCSPRSSSAALRRRPGKTGSHDRGRLRCTRAGGRRRAASRRSHRPAHRDRVRTCG